MANYPGAIDSAASMYTPVDSFSGKPLETTTTGAVLAGDSTINVAATAGGFAATYGILSIDDELVVYTGKTGTQFTGCQRGAFGTAATGHGNGVAVKANMVAGFITALQSALVAIETELGTAAARNYIRKDGAVTITGLKTFQDGAEFGAGTKSSIGLVRLPNAGAIKWRKQDNSGDLGIALNASNHLAMDAIIDFAAGQTFGASTVPDATTLAKGVVQIDPVGGISVSGGVISLAASGVGPGTYTKLIVDTWGRATAGALLAAGDLPAHTHTASDIVSGALPFTIQNNGSAVGTRRALNLIQGASIGLSFTDVPGSDRVNVTIALGAHTHAQADVTSLVTDLAGKAALSHTHTSSQITDATAAGTPATLVLRDGSGGANFGYAAANNLWAFLDSHLQSVECGAFGVIGGPYENMAKYSEDFSVGTWDKNGGSCSVVANAAAAPDGNTTADQIAASTATPVLQQNIAGLVDGGTYTFYVWAKVASGTRRVSIAIVNNAYGAYLAGPMQITLTSSWQRFKITGTLAGGQTALWIVVRQFAGNGDDWTSGNILLWGVCLQQGNDPKKAYARTWGYQAGPVAAGVACGPLLVVGKDTTESPFKVRGPGSNLADHTLLEVTAGGELIIASGSGNGYRLAEIVGASNPSGWSGCLKVKNPAGVTAGYILLYSNP
ncbi:MAG: carbohydrate binding domain-containing protein [Acidobacteriales bacterium]|nr:carbohydrate binding domain-containing protein [Terriglobales bacterium]